MNFIFVFHSMMTLVELYHLGEPWPTHRCNSFFGDPTQPYQIFVFTCHLAFTYINFFELYVATIHRI